jgi:hypothetical protein
MTDRFFSLRLNCTYQGAENNIDDLSIEVLNDGEWETLELSIRSPGFLLFINGLFSCQHLYMRTNSAERDLLLENSSAEFEVVADETWHIKNVDVAFSVKLKSGTPGEDDIAYIKDRMGHCPVSSNLPESIQLKKSIHFHD